jgi:hypothetical protein
MELTATVYDTRSIGDQREARRRALDVIVRDFVAQGRDGW